MTGTKTQLKAAPGGVPMASRGLRWPAIARSTGSMRNTSSTSGVSPR